MELLETRPRFAWRALFITAVLAVMLASFAASASAQSICEQYPDLPQCTEDEDDVGDNDNDGRDDDAAPTGGGGSGDIDTAGDLPFTGYPTTPLVLLTVMLVAAGLVVRGWAHFSGPKPGAGSGRH